MEGRGTGALGPGEGTLLLLNHHQLTRRAEGGSNRPPEQRAVELLDHRRFPVLVGRRAPRPRRARAWRGILGQEYGAAGGRARDKRRAAALSYSWEAPCGGLPALVLP